MISAATGSMALVVVSLVKDHGVEYLLAATILAGAIQVALGLLRVPRLMRFVPRSVMTGFVNALAILIYLAQVPYIVDGGGLGVALVAGGLLLLFVVPRLTTAIPAPLIAIVAVTVLVVAAGLSVPNVGDQGELPGALPFLGVPLVPFNLQTLQIVLPYSITLAAVGLLESLMTASLSTTSPRRRRTRTARRAGRASPTSSPASSAAWPAAR